MNLEKHANSIEALIFASERSITVDEINQVLVELGESEANSKKTLEVIESIKKRYASMNLAIELVEINGGYQFLTRKEYYPAINQLQIQRSKKKLSQASMETLAIIAYKQPITKLEIEQIRGVNCDYTVQKLLEKELITIMGKADTVGKPILYGISGVFMDYFGINSSADLPQLKDLQPETNAIGEPSE